MAPKAGQKTVLITGYVSRLATPQTRLVLTSSGIRCTPGGIGHALALEFHAKGISHCVNFTRQDNHANS